MFDLNPLDVLDKREMKYLPVHFSKVVVADSDLYDTKLSSWIRNKLKGRYFIGRCPSIDSDDKLKTVNVVAFEQEKELTYFMLACPYLRRIK